MSDTTPVIEVAGLTKHFGKFTALDGLAAETSAERRTLLFASVTLRESAS